MTRKKYIKNQQPVVPEQFERPLSEIPAIIGDPRVRSTAVYRRVFYPEDVEKMKHMPKDEYLAYMEELILQGKFTEVCVEDKYPKESPLIGVLVAILWISIIGTAYAVYKSIEGFDHKVFSYVEIILSLTSIMGAVLILRLNKWGYWLMVGARVLFIIFVLIQNHYLQKQGFDIQSSVSVELLIRDVGQIAFLSLLMLIKKNGKNAFQVLWLQK